MVKTEARGAAIERAKAEVLLRPVYLDTETTGIGIADQIVDICVLDHCGEVLVDSLVKPKGRIPLEATAIHGISDEMVKDAPTWEEIWPSLEAALKGRRVAVYNAKFDAQMMEQSHRKYGMRWSGNDMSFTCIMELYARFRGDWNSSRGSYRWHRLEDAARQCGIEPAGLHRARADALLARRILLHMAES